jgi:hypothetical protein
VVGLKIGFIYILSSSALLITNTNVYIGDPEQFVEYGMKGGIIGE